MALQLGSITAADAGTVPELLGEPVRAAVVSLGLGERIGAFPIDAELSETAATQQRYGLDPATLVNCVLIAGRRDGVERIAACLVPATKRVDVNGVVRRRLDVRKASFLAQDVAVERSGMAYGAITPVGLPADWALLVDADILATPVVLVGSGIRASKLLVPGALLAELPNAEVVESLGRPTP